MENQQLEPKSEKPGGSEEDNGADIYHRPQRLIRISSFANILSWVTLVFVVLITIFFVSISVISFRSFPNASLSDLIPTLTTAIILIIPGLFLFTVLQAVSESIYLLMDIEENTRSK
jgi:hypothetical protein